MRTRYKYYLTRFYLVQGTCFASCRCVACVLALFVLLVDGQRGLAVGCWPRAFIDLRAWLCDPARWTHLAVSILYGRSGTRNSGLSDAYLTGHHTSSNSAWSAPGEYAAVHCSTLVVVLRVSAAVGHVTTCWDRGVCVVWSPVVPVRPVLLPTCTVP